MIKERQRKYGERRATTGPSGGLGGRERERKKKLGDCGGRSYSRSEGRV